MYNNSTKSSSIWVRPMVSLEPPDLLQEKEFDCKICSSLQMHSYEPSVLVQFWEQLSVSREHSSMSTQDVKSESRL